MAGAGADQSADPFGRLLTLLNRLEENGLAYSLAHIRPESLLVSVATPGWRWEVEFMASGEIEVERFRSHAGVEVDPGLIDELLRQGGK